MKKKDILLIDDEELTRDEFAHIFEETIYELHLAVNSIEGLEFIKSHHVDLILLDIIMPDLKNIQSKVAGIELLKIIRELRPNLPVIMITAVNETKIAVETLKLGAKDYIIKDELSSKELIRKIEEALKYEERQLENLITSGENDKLEFKSTIRWSLKKNIPDKGVEFSWLKTIVAFMNTNGGILLMGVKDNKTILGIEADNFQNEDKYLLHFNNLINQHIGIAFFKFIKYELVPVDGKKILLVECGKSDEPAFLRKTKENEEFYIRVGPSSRKLTMSEMLNYLKDK